MFLFCFTSSRFNLVGQCAVSRFGLCQVRYISFDTTGVFDTRWTQIAILQIKLTLRQLRVFEIDIAELMESPILLAAQKYKVFEMQHKHKT
jgi:hypothetical protein